ncbi:MAG: hypothetical protein J6U54_20290 [Clostridiales bacterium]|nr:hypothetical protein [Clostridiales bacterium]
MYCKFKDGDLVMIVKDTKTYYGACVRKWVHGTVMTCFAADGRYDGYVGILLGKDNFTLIPIKDLKKISIKKIPKGSYRAPRFNNEDHVVYKGKTGVLAIEGWVVDNKPYYNECKIVIRTKSGKHKFVNECDALKIHKYAHVDTDMAYKWFCNSTYGMTAREFEYCANDVVVTANLMKKHEQKLKEISNMLNDGRIIQYKREGNTITATLYDTKEISDCCKTSREIISASAKCHPDDRFDLDLGMGIAFKRLSAKWKLINKKSNLQKFKDGEIWVKTDKENFIDFMAICARRDISWRCASALGWIPNGLLNGRPIYVKVDPEAGYMSYHSYPLDSKSVITVSDLLK